MKKKQDDKFFDEYIQNRKNSSFYINEVKTNRKMKKGLKNIANNLREIAHKLDEAAEEKKCVDIVNENWD